MTCKGRQRLRGPYRSSVKIKDLSGAIQPLGKQAHKRHLTGRAMLAQIGNRTMVHIAVIEVFTGHTPDEGIVGGAGAGVNAPVW